MEIDRLIPIANIIFKNIEQNGLYRYDRMDIKWHPALYHKNSKWNKLRKPFLVMDELFPSKIREVLKIQKRIFPNTYEFIIHSLYIFEKNDILIKTQKSSIEYMQICLNQYLTFENGIPWWNYFKEQFSNTLEIYQNKRPTMHIYGLARLNRLLIDLGRFYNKEQWIRISCMSLKQTIYQNNLIETDELAYISYFYNSDDYIINANTEFAHWLADVLSIDSGDKSLMALLYKLINMILREQNDDGSWYYYSKRNIINNGYPSDIDCHHTGTVLYNLISIASMNILDINKNRELVNSINIGMKYYLNTFFLNPQKVKVYIGKKRPAGVTQYSEAIYAFCIYLKHKNLFNHENSKKISGILPIIMENNIKLINPMDGSAKGEKVLKWVNIDSIRWGNGPVLEAIACYLEYLKNEQENPRQ